MFYASLVPQLSFYMLLKNVLLSQSQKYGILLPSQVTTFSPCMFFVPLRIVYLTSRICSFSAAFLLYAVLVLIAVFILVFHYIPSYGQTHIMCYVGVCSLVGSLSVRIVSCLYMFTSLFFFFFFFIIYLFQVMSVKAIGIALKLTLSGTNQLVYPQTWAFTFIVLLCVITQMNYLNKVTTAISF